MKKTLIFLLSLLILSGCELKIDNTPTKKVEDFFSKYQTLDKSVLDKLNDVIVEEEKFNTEGREAYREVIKNQYSNLEYKIKEEKVDGENAVVTAEITVNDFTKVISSSELYKDSHPEEFKDESGEYRESIYTNYVIDKLKDVKNRIKYTLDLELTKVNDKWQMNELDSEEQDKLLGIYNY